MTVLSRADRQTAALVDLLKSLPEKQLVDVLDKVGATIDVPKGGRRSEACGICGRVYPVCRKLYEDDHAFERPRRG